MEVCLGGRYGSMLRRGGYRCNVLDPLVSHTDHTDELLYEDIPHGAVAGENDQMHTHISTITHKHNTHTHKHNTHISTIHT